jgi:chloride channel 7
MDGNHAPHTNQHTPPLPERDGSFNYDIESMDGGGGLRGGPSPWNGSSDALLRFDDDGTRESLLRYDDDGGGPREPLLRKRTMNTTSQIAIVGANVFPIESLDYEYVPSPKPSPSLNFSPPSVNLQAPDYLEPL